MKFDLQRRRARDPSYFNSYRNELLEFTLDEPEERTNIVFKGHPQHGDITEDDIQTTMQNNNMTREQVLDALGIK